MSRNLSLPCMMLLFASVCAIAAEPRAEIVNVPPDSKPVPKSVPPKAGDKTSQNIVVNRPELNIDEPGFKASVTFPERTTSRLAPSEAAKARKKIWDVPLEETLDGQIIPPSDDSPEDAKKRRTGEEEEISPELAAVIAKEKSGSKVLTDLALLADVQPENAAVRYRFGIALYRSGEIMRGLSQLEKAIALNPNVPKYQCDYGLIALQSGKLQQAVVACQNAALSVPANARYQSALGDTQLAAGSVGDAVDSYTRAVSIEPTNSTYLFNLGLAYMHLRAFKRAEVILDEAINIKKDAGTYYCSRGVARENLRNVSGAIEDYSAALRIDKNNAYAHYLLAGAYSDPDDPTYTNKFYAVEHAEKAVKLTKSRNAQYLMGLARAYRVSREYEQAILYAKKAVELDPTPQSKHELSIFEQLKSQGYTK